MKKFLLISCFLVVTAASARGQVIIALLFGDKLNSGKLTFGLSLGVNYSTIGGYNDGKRYSSFNLGLFFMVHLSDRWYLQPEAVPKYSFGRENLPVYSLGNPDLDKVLAGGSVTRKINGIAVPVSIHYRLVDHFSVGVGPQITLLTKKSKDIFTAGDLEYTKDISDQVSRFDFGFVADASYRFMKGTGVKVSIRYYQGMVDVLPGNASNLVNSFQANVYIPVGRAKKNKLNE